jgi:hypothetical protein
MSTLIAFIQNLLPHIPSQAERQEAYLADSADLAELERRMRDIDERQQLGALAGGLPVHWGTS